MKKGDIVKVHLWHGVIVDVYRSGDKEIAEVWFVKNIFKMQQPEFLPAAGLEPATLDGLLKEINVLTVGLERSVEQLRLLAARSG